MESTRYQTRSRARTADTTAGEGTNPEHSRGVVDEVELFEPLTIHGNLLIGNGAPPTIHRPNYTKAFIVTCIIIMLVFVVCRFAVAGWEDIIGVDLRIFKIPLVPLLFHTTILGSFLMAVLAITRTLVLIR